MAKRNFVKNKKSLTLAIVGLLLVMISVGYALMTATLKINGATGVKENTWIIYFNNVVEKEGTATSPAVITDPYDARSNIAYTVDFSKPGENYVFTVDIVNDGTTDAMINDFGLTGIDDSNRNLLEYTITYLDGTPLQKCDELPAKRKRGIIVTVNYKKDIQKEDLPEDDIRANLDFYVEYVYKDESACNIRPIPNLHTLTIDPNGGIYGKDTDEETTEEIVKPMEKGEPYKLLNFTRQGYELVLDLSEIDEYNEETGNIEMGNNDIVIKPDWNLIDLTEVVAKNVDTSKYYPTIESAFDEAQNGETIELLKDTTENPVNNTNGSIYFNIGGYKVTGTLINNKNLTIYNGVIENLDGNGAINNGTLTMGKNDGTVLVDEAGTVALIGSSTSGIGLKNNGTFNFYDGYLEADVGLSGMYDDIPEGYFVFVDHNDEKDCQKVYLTNNNELRNRAVAKTIIEGLPILYYNLQDAFDSSMDSEEELIVYAIRDFEAAYPLHIDENTSVTFDLDGWNVKTGESITNDGELNLTDSQSGVLKPSITLTNNGTLNIENIVINETTDANVITNSGSIDIKASTVKALNGYALYNVGEAVITGADDGILDSDNYAVYNSSIFELDGGRIKGVRGGIYNAGTVKLVGGIVDTTSTSGTSYGIYNAGGTSVNEIGNMTFNVTASGGLAHAIYNNSGSTTIEDTIFNISGVSVNGVTNGGTLNIADVDFNMTSTTGAINGLHVGTLVVDDGDINMYSNGGSISAINVSSTLQYNGGTLKAINQRTASSANIFTGVGASLYVNGGEFESSGNCASLGNMYGVSLTINGGKLTCGGKGVNSWGSLTINGGEIYSVDDGYYGYSVPYGSSSFTMTGGKIVSSAGYGVHHTAGTAVKIGSADKTSIPHVEGYKDAIYITGGSLTLPKGTVISHNGYGVHISVDTVIGINEGDTPLKTTPSIRGNTYGLYIESGSTKFYDGILKGQTDGYYGRISAIAEGSELKTDTEEIDGDTYITWFLENSEPFARIGDVEFNSLQKAFDYVEEEATIEIIKNAKIQTASTLDNGKKVIIDLKGYQLTSTQAINNKGDLTIIDTSTDKTGKFISDSTMITNENKFTADHVYLATDSVVTSYIVYNNSGSAVTTFDECILVAKSTGTAYAVYNNGTTNINKGTITVNGGNSYAVGGSGTLNVDETVVTSTATGTAYGFTSGYMTFDNISLTVNGGSAYGFTGNNRVDVNGGTFDISGSSAVVFTAVGAANYINDNAIMNSTGNCVSIGNMYGGSLTLNSGVLTCGGMGINAWEPVVINGGEIHSVSDAFYGYSVPYGSASLRITGGKLISSESYGVRYSSGYEVVVGDPTTDKIPYIEGATYGMHMTGGSLKLLAGEIIGKSKDGIYTTVTTTIGENEGEVSIEKPLVQGKEYGLNISGATAYFYDGILKGQTWGYCGGLNVVPEGYTPKDDEETIGEELYKTDYLVVATDFLRVGTQEFNSLQKAVDAIDSEGEIIAFASGVVKSNTTIPDGKTITLNFDGNVINVSSQIVNNGNLLLKDDSTEKTGGLTCVIESCLYNTKDLTVTTGNYNSGASYMFHNNRNMFIKEGANIVSSAYAAIGNYTNSSTQPVTTMDGGRIIVEASSGDVGAVGSTRSSSSYNFGKFVFNGGTIEVNSAAGATGVRNTYAVMNGGQMDVTSTTGTAIGFDGSSLDMKSGVLNVNSKGATYGVRNAGLTISGGTINSISENNISYGLYNGTINATNGKMVVRGTSNSTEGIYGSGTINYIDLESSKICLYGNYTINDGEFNCGTVGITARDTTYLKGGLFNTAGNTVNAEGNTVITGGTYISTEGYGVYLNNSGKSITIGTLDGDIDTASPSIRGSLYGVYINNGKFNFYDGILKGQTNGYYGTVYSIEPEATINDDEERIDEVLYQTDYLIINGDIIKNKTQDKLYNNIQSAIDEALENDELELLSNASVMYDINVANDKKIVIDMMGFNITTTKSITNNGNLILINSSDDESKISTSLVYNLFVNNGVLRMNKIFINFPTNNRDVRPVINSNSATLEDSRISSGYYGIENKSSGTLNIINGNIYGGDSGVLNYGSLGINGATITGGSYAVYSNTSQTVSITDSTLSSSSAVYSVTGASNTSISGCTLTGQVYNGNGEMTVTGGTLNGNLYNLTTMNVDGLDIDFDNNSNYYDYTLVYNKGNMNLLNSTMDVVRSVNSTSEYYVNGVYNTTGNIELSGSSISVKETTNSNFNNKRVILRGFTNEGNGTFSFVDTSVEVENGKTSYGIYNDSSVVSTDLKNLDLKLSGANTSYGIYNNKGTLNVKTAGEEKSTLIDVASVSSYGIYINTADATVNLGINDGDGTENSNVSVTDPLIKAMGTTSGVGVRKVNGKFNYFDGKIIGSTLAKPDTTTNVESRFEARFFLVTDTEPGVEVKSGEEEGEYIYEYCILQYLGPENDG